jgi:hypothetical protein
MKQLALICDTLYLRPWQSTMDDPLQQVRSIAYRARNGMGGNRAVRDTENELLKLYEGKKLTSKEINALNEKFNLTYLLGLYVGGGYNPKHTQEKFELLRSEIQLLIKRVVLDLLTDVPA